MKDQDSVTPGGLLGMSTKLDPGLSKSDALSGSVVGLPGKLPPVREELKLKVSMLKRLVGPDGEAGTGTLEPGVPLMLTSG